MRAYVYQARSLIGSDDSGLSDPFARVVVGEYCKTTQVIEETLSPTWDELMVFDEILVYGRREDIKANPPSIIIETFDQDKVRSEKKYAHGLMRALAGWKSRVSGKSNRQTSCVFGGRCKEKQKETDQLSHYQVDYCPPKLEWFQILRGNEEAGRL